VARPAAQVGSTMAPATATGNDNSCVRENALNLFIQLVTVGDNGDASIRIGLQYPLGKQLPSPMEARLFFSSSTQIGNAIYVEHDVGSPLMIALERNLLGNGEVVLLRLIPVDEVDGLRDLACLDLNRHAVAQQVIDGLIIVVERAVVVIRG
jgi:hypothetical protein